MKCDYCQCEGNQFTAIIQDCETRAICRKCIKLGHAEPKAKKRQGFVPCFDYTQADGEA